MKRYIALLRGINVGGKNIIKMSELKACFESMGFESVVTYIQSGNVLFDSDDSDTELITLKIESKLSEQFNYVSKIVLVSQQNLIRIVKAAPEVFGIQKDEYRYDIIFLKPPLTAGETISKIKVKEGVDFVKAGDGVLYFWRLSKLSSQSQMTKLIGMAIYKEMTIRNWNTTLKLCEL